MTADLYSIEAKGGILGLELWFNNPPLWGRRPPLPLGLGSFVHCAQDVMRILHPSKVDTNAIYKC